MFFCGWLGAWSGLALGWALIWVSVSRGTAHPLVVLDNGPARFILATDSGSVALVDLRTGVSWETDRSTKAMGMVTVERPTGAREFPLRHPRVELSGEGLWLTFFPDPEQPAARFHLRVCRLRTSAGFSFQWHADPELAVRKVRLFDRMILGRASEEACAYLPVRMGLMIPAAGQRSFRRRFETYAYEGCHMAMLGVRRRGTACLWTWDSPELSVELERQRPPNGADAADTALSVTFEFRRDEQRLCWIPVGPGTHVQVAAQYRAVARQAGWWVPRSEKLRGHPDRANYSGASNVKLWSLLHRRMDPSSTRELEVRVNWTFDQAARVAEHLKYDLGLERVLFGLGGWIHRGYDNQHPDILPPAPECGGTEPFRDACRRILALGYLLALHDNYQDMYRDAPSWGERWLNKNPDGSPTRGGVWAGGQAWIVCSRMAIELARRPQNLPAVKQLSGAKACFIDTTLAAGLLECHDPHHPLTRWEDLRHKQALCKYARGLFGSFGSEDGREWGIPYTDYFEGLAGVGGYEFHDRNLIPALEAVPIPLFELVYRECVQVYGKYGYDPAQVADYVLHHLLLGRPLHYHNLPPGLYWSEDRPELVRPLVSEVQARDPRSFEIRYAWEVERPPDKDWRVFVHFCDESGQIRFQNDHDPIPPTSQWPTGRVMQGPFVVSVPPGLQGRFSVRLGWYRPSDGSRAWLQGPMDGERRVRAGHLMVEGDRIRWEPEAHAEGPGTVDPALFLRADRGWAEGLHPWDRFLKNTHELLSPLNALTADLPMTDHTFLTVDRLVQRVTFGQDGRLCTVVVNRGTGSFAWDSPRYGTVLLPPGGFMVESDRFVAFHALSWNGLKYASAPFFTMQSLDGRPLARSRRVRIFHGFGDPQIRLGRQTRTVLRETILDLWALQGPGHDPVMSRTPRVGTTRE